MPPLPSDLRNKLERTIIAARDAAEAGALAAIEAMAVQHHEPYPHQKPDQRKLRNQLRARARQLGDLQNAKGTLALDHLVHECAYEHWHRMLFARFLAENDLLIEPGSGVAISLAECEELAKEAKTDLWTYASRCAQQMLPQIFRPDDPLLQVALATEHRIKLEQLLGKLDVATFKADDALGWVYQFWQSKKKDEVNASGDKITGDTLPAVTQLFTEHYMVLVLLHNTLGAWHAGKVLAANLKLAESAGSEDELRQAVALSTGGGYSFEYLRFVRGADGKGGAWRPAAGVFASWPVKVAEVKMLDPCCGSGHFLIACFELLVRLRMQEEKLSMPEAVDAVLRDNLHGLELDPRCTQIAAFNVALAAWKLTGHRTLPAMHIACTGIGPSGTMEEWVSFAAKSSWRIRPLERSLVEDGLKGMHQLFSQAPTLGSLINPHDMGGSLITADYETLKPHLVEALSAELGDDLAHERAVAAAGMAKAAELLADEYSLVVTNVPYLAMRRQGPALRQYLKSHYADSKADLATAVIDRFVGSAAVCKCFAAVTPQHWLFQDSYTDFRGRLLRERSWLFVARLGPGSFETISGEIVNVSLVGIAFNPPTDSHVITSVNCVEDRTPVEKAAKLSRGVAACVTQISQRANPDSRITMEVANVESPLSDVAHAPQGIITGDLDHWQRKYWEVLHFDTRWQPFLSTTPTSHPFAGRQHAIDWNNEGAEMIRPRPGNAAVGRDGVAVSQIGELPTSLYFGELYDGNVAPIVPFKALDLAAIYSYCCSSEFHNHLRVIDNNMKVTNGVLLKAPFDLSRWKAEAAEKYPNGLPEPESDDPTQWLFHGRPETTTAPLQVAVARLLGYCWPAEIDDKMRLSKRAKLLVKQCDALMKFADDDGIVCVPSVRGEESAADRLLGLLTTCDIKPDHNLDEWLRDDFFQEHCELFHHRPFIWHIWDGRKRDGFHALVNYHKLADGKKGRKLLESLTYSYLGEWISRQQDGVKHGTEGAEDRLAAALELKQRLESILKGEPPYDLFIRWKPLHEQPIGWEPDINDGVRMNIRPFLASDLPNGKKGAGILRWKPNIKWDKDRGKEPERKKAEYPWFWGWDELSEDFMGGKEFKGERFNDCHYTVAAKRKARDIRKEKS